MKGPSHLGTSCLPAPASVDLGDRPEDLHLLIDEGVTSTVVARAHSDPQVHSLHDQSSQVDVIVDPYVQQLVEVSLSVAEIDGSVEQVQQTSFSISTGILKQVSGPPHIFSSVPVPVVLPKGRNTIQHSWTDFFIGAAFTCRHSSFGGEPLLSLFLLLLSLVYFGCMS